MQVQQQLQRPQRQSDILQSADHQTPQQMVAVRSVPHLLVEPTFPGENVVCPPSNQQQQFNQILAPLPSTQPAIRIRQSRYLFDYI